MVAHTALSAEEAALIAAHFREGADEDMATAELLFAHARYAPCLFFLHLAIEKSLKVHVAECQRAVPPYTHDLIRLAELGGITPSDEQRTQLRVVNQFNLHARYDDYKREFAKLATREYAQEHLQKGKALFVWIRQYTQSKK